MSDYPYNDNGKCFACGQTEASPGCLGVVGALTVIIGLALLIVGVVSHLTWSW